MFNNSSWTLFMEVLNTITHWWLAVVRIVPIDGTHGTVGHSFLLSPVTLSMLHFFLLVSISPSLFPLFILFPFLLLLITMAIIYSILSSPPTVLCHKLDVYTWCLALSPTLFPIATFITLICKQEHSAAKWRAGPLPGCPPPTRCITVFCKWNKHL